MIQKGLLALGAVLAVSPAFAQDQERFTAERVFDLEYADAPSVSPDGKTILYVRRSMDRMKDVVAGDLWEVDLDAGTQRPVPGGEGISSLARWSPSGDRFLTTGEVDGGPVLRIHYADTGESYVAARLDKTPASPVWSPDGEMIAFSMLVPSEAEPLATPPKKPEGAEWSAPVKVIDDVTFRFDGRGFLERGHEHVFVVPAEGGTPRQLTEGKADYGSPAWLNGKTLLVAGNDADDRDLDIVESDIFRVDIESKEITALTRRDGPDVLPKVSPRGDLVAFSGYDDEQISYQQSDLYVMRPDGRGVRNLTEGYDRTPARYEWLPDGSGLVALAEIDGDLSLIAIPLSGEPTVLAGDVGGTSIGRPYASGAFSLAAKGDDLPVIAYTRASTQRPAELAVIGEDGKTATLTALNDDILPFLDLAEVEEIEVPSSAGGLPIEAWVALPPGFEKDGSYPMILEIHGGPFAMYGPSFAAEIQRYAAEGYVTVYANPRGSTGYGEAFAREIDLAYPGRDYDDLMSVVDHLVKEGYVDEERLFVTGGSGGGVLTAWIVGNTDRFAAAATVKPVINWTTMALSADIAPLVARNWMQALPWENPERYWSLSPISRVGQVTTPTLVMVGEEDWRTPAWEAEQFYTALHLLGVDTALVRIPGASHSIASRPSRLIAKVDNIMGWFERYDQDGQEDGPLPKGASD